MKTYFTILRAKKKTYGGPGTFINILCNWFKLNKFNYEFYPSTTSKNILVISSSRHLFYLLKNKFFGKKIIQRLDGYLWDIHLQKNFQVKIRYFIINFLMNFIRKYLADTVVYQTKSLEKSWNRKYGKINKKIRSCSEIVIYNSTLDKLFRNKLKIKNRKFKIICVEGSIQNNEYTFNIIKSLAIFSQTSSLVESFSLYGNYPISFKNRLSQFYKTRFEGQKEKNYIMNLYNYEKTIFFCLEQYPACPNSVIEAIASDTIVVGFNNGSLKEMLEEKSYIIDCNDIGKLKNFYFVRNQIFNKLFFCIKNYNKLQKRLILISKKFRSEKMSKQYLRVFEK